MNELENCPNCGKLFIRALRGVCNNCFSEVENKFKTVHNFIRRRENRMATVDEVHEATEVKKDLIYQFIREGRILLAQFPNLGFPCEKCGTFIKEGRICESCRKELRSGLDQLSKESAFQDRQKQREREKIQTYHSLEDRIKRGR
ncbi:TIGR03826 family flagellar region protein [Evansella tamaricis]|uniref:Flagellar protein n=1 Tax=Evansella tamaricis TaxID=2069301 RepID=A0ABS6JE41_9BACI|nr:TIGR03826 family flagellar region protein [Evansella tamaricis]MBU9711768.1 hypothetical protein [Evansella tamaricis]